MIKREILQELKNWAVKKNRKPMVLRGARQVGKTTVVNEFSKNFTQYIRLNLELPEDKKPFRNFSTIENLVQTIFISKGKQYSLRKNTLLFIDEIQEVPEAFNLLRYFYEEIPEMPVIVAGSLLETLFQRDLQFPVGRVEFLVMRPVSFYEFLQATNEKPAIKEFEKVPVSLNAHEKLITLFHTYALIGGMPEIVKTWMETKDITALSSVYDSLITSYSEDVEKYANSEKQTQVLRHVIQTSFIEAGKRIKFQNFGKSAYGSREVAEAFRTLEKVFLLHLIYPFTGYKLPIEPELQKSPRLHLLDTGLINYKAGLQAELIGTKDLNAVYQGKIIEHLIGQEILSKAYSPLAALQFWVREKNTSTAEVDYLIHYKGKIIPVEVKSGKTGKLKSLHLFMDESPSTVAIRFYRGEFSVTETVTPNGKKFRLLNLPYYLVSKIEDYLIMFEKQKK
ncbi:MAG: ATP-binding protein [Bacteroidota bacterium]